MADRTDAFIWPWPYLEQFIQIASAGPGGIDAGSLVSKADKAALYDLGLVTPKYGATFRLTDSGVRTWESLHRMIVSADPWRVVTNG